MEFKTFEIVKHKNNGTYEIIKNTESSKIVVGYLIKTRDGYEVSSCGMLLMENWTEGLNAFLILAVKMLKLNDRFKKEEE